MGPTATPCRNSRSLHVAFSPPCIASACHGGGAASDQVLVKKRAEAKEAASSFKNLLLNMLQGGAEDSTGGKGKKPKVRAPIATVASLAVQRWLVSLETRLCTARLV